MQTKSTIGSELLSRAWSLLKPFITEERQLRLQKVAESRTNHIRLVLENIRDPHNVSACLRSADAFGLLNIDVVSSAGFKTSTVAKGADNWLKVTKHEDTSSCVKSLKTQGYMIAAAYPPHVGGVVALQELPVDAPIAVVFGNERAGISETWDDNIDFKFTIPMCGMVESLNISVSAAITMNTLRQKTLNDKSLNLRDSQINELLNEWILRQFKDPEGMLAKLDTKENCQ